MSEELTRNRFRSAGRHSNTSDRVFATKPDTFRIDRHRRIVQLFGVINNGVKSRKHAGVVENLRVACALPGYDCDSGAEQSVSVDSRYSFQR